MADLDLSPDLMEQLDSAWRLHVLRLDPSLLDSFNHYLRLVRHNAAALPPTEGVPATVCGTCDGDQVVNDGCECGHCGISAFTTCTDRPCPDCASPTTSEGR